MNPLLQPGAAPILPASRMLPVTIVAGVLVALLLISAAVRWYAREVSMPRYCNDPQGALARLERILIERKPAPDNQARAPYLVAAKLIFLLPQASNEPTEAYLARVAARIDALCRGAAPRLDQE